MTFVRSSARVASCFLLTVVVLCLGCRPTTSAPADASSTFSSSRDVLLVVIGGWGSCQKVGAAHTPRGMFLDAQSEQVARVLSSRDGTIRVRRMLICARKMLLGTTLELPAWYVQPDDPRVFKIGPADDTITNAVIGVWTRLGKPRVAVAGHSYGGYHAMKLAAEFFARTRAKVDRVYTIEPISPETCGPVDAFNANMAKEWDAGCLKAPGELWNGRRIASESIDARMTLAASERWINYLVPKGQTRVNGVQGMHSGPFAAPGVVQVDVELPVPYGPAMSPHENNHHRAGFVNSVWTRASRSTSPSICQDLAALTGVSDAVCEPIRVHPNTGQRLAR